MNSLFLWAGDQGELGEAACVGQDVGTRGHPRPQRVTRTAALEAVRNTRLFPACQALGGPHTVQYFHQKIFHEGFQREV
jgi:hypothetical protein